MYVPKYEFGWNRRTGWLHGDEASYNNAVALMKTIQPGRARTRPINESWNKVLQLFDSTNPQRSQGAFCRWAGIKPATFSNWKNKPLSDETESLIKRWHWIGDGQGLDGSMNTNQDRMETTQKTLQMERGRIIYKQHRENGYAVPGLKKKKGVQNE